MGGNLDLNDLAREVVIFFPVFQTGAQFFTGDPHQVQANGEVSGTALELSNTVTMQFIVQQETASIPARGNADALHPVRPSARTIIKRPRCACGMRWTSCEPRKASRRRMRLAFASLRWI